MYSSRGLGIEILKENGLKTCNYNPFQRKTTPRKKRKLHNALWIKDINYIEFGLENASEVEVFGVKF